MSTTDLRTDRTALKRHAERGAHDFETIARILDEALYCHIGFVDDGQPYVVPTGYGRDGRTVYVHGSTASRMLKTLSGGVPLSMTVTLLDGLVLARSAFHHSINYRSVMIVGVAREVAEDEKLHGLEVITEHLVPGRWADVRPPNPQELKATAVLKLDIDEASAKVRSGPSKDDEADLARDCWAGELPFVLTPQPPVPDRHTLADAAVPDYVSKYRRPSADQGISGAVA